ncbi:MAG: DegT/DnrJ/EryC1/StrS family aminotransferase [Armatimonadota bacterium]|nr:DegT/DnrJ/EryC1/StrS family aminotransferase [Armatimonadota bacterium]
MSNTNGPVPTERAKYGAAAVAHLTGELPNPFPRIMGPNAMKYLREIVDSGLSVDMLSRFESAFAEAYGVKHCIATPGCTPALAVLGAAFGFEPGDEVIVSPVTDYGTLMGLLVENYIPVFADTEPGTVNVSAATIEPRITDRTRAILVVHKTGLICDMDPINRLAQERGLIVYEDVCQAVFGEYKGQLAGTLSKAAGFSFDSEKTMGSDVGGCIITDDDDLAGQARFLGHSRGARQMPGFGRIHTARGYAHRMPQCTAAISLAQLEIIRPNVAHRDKMARLLLDLIGQIPGLTPLPIPDYVNVYSCWMIGFSIDPTAFRCTADEFGEQLAEEGIPGAGTGRYYLMPEALTFLREKAEAKAYPFSTPPASREFSYGADTCPNAHAFLENFVRWATFCEKYAPEHCELAAEIIRRVAERNRDRS